jgi:hypothetical protein
VASDYYEYNSSKGIFTICRKKDCPNHWELRLYTESNEDAIVIRSDYLDPNEAAFDASKADFGIIEIDELFRNVYVPSELQFWRTFRSVYRRKIVSCE